MDKNDKTKNEKTATTETQKKSEAQKFSVSDKFSASAVAASDAAVAIEALKQKIEEFEDKYKRILADYQNLEKRVIVERKEWILKSNKELLLHLLPVLDTLILAKKHIKVEDEGLSLSIKQFQDLLKAEGVEKIEVVGKQFDPNIMQCVETQESEEGKVLDEIRTGYKLYDQILRPAQVKVGRQAKY